MFDFDYVTKCALRYKILILQMDDQENRVQYMLYDIYDLWKDRK